MKIEVGKYYKTRDGRKVCPMESPHTEKVVWCDDDGKQYGWYSRNGVAFGTGDTHQRDIISEWPSPDEGPIREVRRREIVPGQWGNINVNCVVDGNVFINVRDDFGHVAFNAEQLREAAHLFNQLAEVLEESQP